MPQIGTRQRSVTPQIDQIDRTTTGGPGPRIDQTGS